MSQFSGSLLGVDVDQLHDPVGVAARRRREEAARRPRRRSSRPRSSGSVSQRQHVGPVVARSAGPRPARSATSSRPGSTSSGSAAAGTAPGAPGPRRSSSNASPAAGAGRVEGQLAARAEVEALRLRRSAGRPRVPAPPAVRARSRTSAPRAGRARPCPSGSSAKNGAWISSRKYFAGRAVERDAPRACRPAPPPQPPWFHGPDDEEVQVAACRASRAPRRSRAARRSPPGPTSRRRSASAP